MPTNRQPDPVPATPAPVDQQREKSREALQVSMDTRQ